MCETYETPPNAKCGTCGAVFRLGEQHTCSTYRTHFTNDTRTQEPPKRIQIDGWWFIIEE